MLLFNKSTDAEPDEDRKTLIWLHDYIENYGPDHGVYLDKPGEVRIDPTASGYQAYTNPKKHEWRAEYGVRSYEDAERYVYDWLRFDKRMNAKRRAILRRLCDCMTYYGPDHGVYLDKAGHIQIDRTASGYQAATRDWSRGVVNLVKLSSRRIRPMFH